MSFVGSTLSLAVAESAAHHRNSAHEPGHSGLTEDKHFLRVRRDSIQPSDEEIALKTHTTDYGCETVDIPEPLPPDIDRGWAWVVLVAAFVSNLIAVGITRAVGVHYVTFKEEFRDSASLTSMLGAVMNSVSGLSGPLASVIANQLSCRVSVMAGGVIAAAGCIISAYATSIQYLLVTYGFLIGLGIGLVYTPTMVIAGQYFEYRRSLALGVATAGLSFGQFILPPILQLLTDYYTWRGSMFVISGFCLQFCVCGALMRPPIIPERPQKRALTQEEDLVKCQMSLRFLDLKVLKNAGFLLLVGAMFLRSMGLAIVNVHVNAYAVKQGGATEFQASTLVSIWGASSLFSCLLTGAAANDPKVVDPLVMLFVSLGYSALFAFSTPLLIGSYITQVLFAAGFGVYITCFVVLMAPMIVRLMDVASLSSAYGYAMLLDGIGFFIAPPVAGYLYDITQDYQYSFYIAGGCLLLGSIILLFIPLAARDVFRSRKNMSVG
ncbi:monocarboxylate transporter 12 [Lingula anatina]|uniref:Monocarboxylate transporter 12 n=1 Tax=Lingula anatina TaxID=7574 RepID=A0A1S3JFM5_LINAN|nr:monocarboxylate transporter 12 [Lingula anatina]|eukprot:XP_013408699.1 monocarboxylate transporter 12 [Lingula anatina]